MTRFAGFDGFVGNSGKSAPVYEPQKFNAGRHGTNAGQAAGVTSISNVYGTLRNKSPKMDQIVNTADQLVHAQDVAAMEAKADLIGSGIAGVGSAVRGKIQADALNAQASAAKKGGMMSMFGGIAAGAIGLLSDEDTKHTVEKIEYACEQLRQLRPVTFFYKEEYSAHPERLHHGFIAQEYQKVMPDATYYDESIGKLTIDTSELIALLVRANQELQERVTRLEVKNVLTSV